MHLKLLQKEQLKKQQKLAIWLEIKLQATALRTSPQNNLESDEEELLRERYISPEKEQKIIDDLRSI